MLYLIEDPGPYEPLSVWREHLRELRKLPQDDEGVRIAKESAERRIAEIEEEKKRRDAR
jgi:hypothetical protein